MIFISMCQTGGPVTRPQDGYRLLFVSRPELPFIGIIRNAFKSAITQTVHSCIANSQSAVRNF